MSLLPQTSVFTPQTPAASGAVSFRNLLSQAWQFTKISWPLASWFVVVSIITLAISVFISTFLLTIAFEVGITTLWLLVPMTFTFVLATALLAVLNFGALLYAATNSEAVSYWQGFFWAWSDKWRLLVVYALISLATFGGLVALVLPGIIISTYLAFAPIVFAREDLSAAQTLNRSWQLVSGNWWSTFTKLFGIGIGIALLDLLLSYITQWTGLIGGVLQTIVSAFALIFILRALMILYEATLVQKPTYLPARNWFLWGAYFIGVIGLIMLAGFYVL